MTPASSAQSRIRALAVAALLFGAHTAYGEEQLQFTPGEPLSTGGDLYGDDKRATYYDNPNPERAQQPTNIPPIMLPWPVGLLIILAGLAGIYRLVKPTRRGPQPNCNSPGSTSLTAPRNHQNP
jgi:hypothetical protein